MAGIAGQRAGRSPYGGGVGGYGSGAYAGAVAVAVDIGAGTVAVARCAAAVVCGRGANGCGEEEIDAPVNVIVLLPGITMALSAAAAALESGVVSPPVMAVLAFDRVTQPLMLEMASRGNAQMSGPGRGVLGRIAHSSGVAAVAAGLRSPGGGGVFPRQAGECPTCVGLHFAVTVDVVTGAVCPGDAVGSGNRPGRDAVGGVRGKAGVGGIEGPVNQRVHVQGGAHDAFVAYGAVVLPIGLIVFLTNPEAVSGVPGVIAVGGWI